MKLELMTASCFGEEGWDWLQRVREVERV
ncbi:hypothetical protein PSEUDO8AS_100096 [Pseudomonas sp. 8AS]|nr:hypothetical protein PSEUDO8AS_100096 [Pseudomonas sp. 8AS]